MDLTVNTTGDLLGFGGTGQSVPVNAGTNQVAAFGNVNLGLSRSDSGNVSQGTATLRFQFPGADDCVINITFSESQFGPLPPGP